MRELSSLTLYVKEDDILNFLNCLDYCEKVEVKWERVFDDEENSYYTIKISNITYLRRELAMKQYSIKEKPECRVELENEGGK